MKPFLATIRPAPRASALLGVALLIGSAGAVKAEPVIVITGEPIDQPSICVMNPRLCVAGNQPIFVNPPGSVPADVIPPGASISADEVNGEVMKKVQAMNCSQLQKEAGLKKREIDNLDNASKKLNDSAASLSLRVNQTSSDYASAKDRYQSQQNIVNSDQYRVNQACDWPKRKKLDGGDIPDVSCNYEKANLTQDLYELASRARAKDAAQQADMAASYALAGVQTGLAYASARMAADRSILDFISTVAGKKGCPAN